MTAFRCLHGLMIGLGLAATSAVNSADLPAHDHAGPYYSATDLGFVVDGASTATAFAINNWAQVGGQATLRDGTDVAFVTGPKGQGVYTLDYGAQTHSTTYALNDRGDAAGTACAADNYFCSAFAVGPKRQKARYLAKGAAVTAGRGINAMGQVVGRYDAANMTYAFVTGPRAKTLRLLDIPHCQYCWANAINDRGQVVGRSFSPHLGIRAFIVDADGKYRDLGMNGAEALAVNASGQVVGTDGDLAFVSSSDGKDAHPLPPIDDATQTRLNGINVHGQAVGTEGATFDGVNQLRAVVTDFKATQLYRLDLLAALPDGVHLENANGINDHGQIVATGSNNHVYVLSPLRDLQ